jgi:FKBP-type peptidyl-prolyl cis-trans isomerase SlyD
VLRDRKLFPEQLETGMAFEGLPEGAVTPDMPDDTIYVVTEIYPSHVVLDGNHPLAGMALRLA